MSFERIDAEPKPEAAARTGPSKIRLQEMLREAVANTGGKPSNNDRRFTDKPELDPGSVRSLPSDHPALVESRTLFPSTVVEVTDDFQDRLLVSGKNNRKLGERILKGKFKGYALYGLSLEERATCPADCGVLAFCYGNGMQMARRHKIGDPEIFFRFLQAEIGAILADPIDGLMVRLHVLGDFPSVEYVSFWADMLDEHDRLACYGYTHRRSKNWGGDEIGEAIQSIKDRYPDRFRIRWSGPVSRPDGAVVTNKIPSGPRTDDGLVCPAQTDATACCASCGLCWEGHARNDTIVFIKHGPKSIQAALDTALIESPVLEAPEIVPDKPPASEGVRPIASITVAQKRDALLSEPPELRLVSPTSLRVEPAYQRDLSGKSIKLIRKIVIGFDWIKFKPPICAETPDGLFVIDGQHTAIAAASHPEIKTIPVMVVKAVRIERRAEAFVAHNRDRLTMTPAQVFYGDVAAGRQDAIAVLKAVTAAGGAIPRLPVQRNYAKPGQVTAVGELRKLCGAGGAALVERIVRIAVIAKASPISLTIICALRSILTEKKYAGLADTPDRQIAAALASVKNIEAAAQHYAAESGQSRMRAAGALIANALKPEQEEVD